jgi:hypothetical protein
VPPPWSITCASPPAVFLGERVSLVMIGAGLLILAGVATAASGGIRGPAVSPDGLAHPPGPADSPGPPASPGPAAHNE